MRRHMSGPQGVPSQLEEQVLEGRRLHPQLGQVGPDPFQVLQNGTHVVAVDLDGTAPDQGPLGQRLGGGPGPLREAHRALAGGSGEALSQAAVNRACEALGRAPFSELEWRTLLEATHSVAEGALSVEAARGVVVRERERRRAESARAGQRPSRPAEPRAW